MRPRLRPPLVTLAAGLLLAALAAAPVGAELSGVVYDPFGAPVAGARVAARTAEASAHRAARWLSAAPERAPVAAAGGRGATAVSDAAGRFSLPAAGEQVLFVEVVAPGFVAAQVAVLPGEESLVVALEPGVEVVGRVVGDDGRPLAGATVVWPRRDHHDVVARTDGEGRFRLTMPRGGGLDGLLVLHPGLAPHRVEGPLAPGEPIVLAPGRRLAGVVEDARGRPVPGARLEVDGLPLGAAGDDGRFVLAGVPAAAGRLLAIAGAQVGEVRLSGADGEVTAVVAPAARVEGTLWLERAGRRRPLAGGAVLVQAIADEHPGPAPRVAVADATGRFVAENLPPGRYLVEPLGGLERRVRGPRSDLEHPPVHALAAGAAVRQDLVVEVPPVVRGRVLDADGRPAAGVAVAVLPEREPSAHLAFDPELPRTDSAGRFELPLFWDGGGGALQVVALRHGHSPARSAPFTVVSERGLPTRDVAIDLRLPPTTTVRVTVTGAAGAPLAGARVVAQPAEEDPGRAPRAVDLLQASGVAVAATPAGTVELHLAAGSHRLAAAAPHHQDGGLEVEVTGRGALAVELALEPAVEVVGQVLRNGLPLAGVEVHLLAPTRNAPAHTGVDGRFRVGGLAPGEHRLVFVSDQGSVREERRVVAPAADLVVELPPAGMLALTVRDRETGEPLEGAVVEVRPLDGASAPARGRHGPRWFHGGRAAAGRIEVTGAPAGEVEVQAGAPGYVPSEPRRTTVPAGGVRELTIELDPGATLGGRVTGEDGAPLAGAHVLAMPTRSADRSRLAVAPAASTDESGSYRLSGLRPGEATVVTVSAGGHVDHREEISVRGDERLDVRLSRGLAISGRVVLGGEALAGAYVSASSPVLGGSSQSAMSGDDGGFTITGLVAAQYVVSAAVDGVGHRQVEGVDPRHGDPVVLDLAEAATGVVEGVVRGLPADAASGPRWPRVAIAAHGDAGAGEGWAESDGSFRLEEVPAGVVRVQAWLEGAEGRSQSLPVVVELAPGGHAWVELDLAVEVTVGGRLSVDGEPVPGARLVFAGEDGVVATGVAGVDGEYSLGLPRAGRYVVSVDHEPDPVLHHRVEVEVAAARRLDLALRAGSLRGTVLDATTGEPIAGAYLALEGGGGGRETVAEAATDGRGRFRLPIATDGPFALLATAEGYGQARAEVREGEEAVIELTPAAGLRVRVVEPGGLPLQAHVLVREAEGGSLPARARHEPDGSLHLSVAPGRYLITALAAGYGQRTALVTAPGELELPLGPAAHLIVDTAPGLSGRLHPIDAAGVEALPCCHPPGWPTTGGVTSIRGLAAGAYRLELRDEAGAVLAAAGVVLEPGATTRLRLE